MAAWGFGAPESEQGLEERFESLGVVGGLGDRTARMFDSYLDEPDNRGTWVIEPARLVKLIRWVHDLGWPMDIHTCGDEAQETVVRAFAAAQRENPKPWLRHRVH